MGEPTLAEFEAWYRETTNAFARGDLERAFADFGEDVEWHRGAWWPETGPVVGRTAIIAYYEEIREVLPGFAVHPREFAEHAPGVFIIALDVTGRGAESGIDVDWVVHVVFETRDGAPSRVWVVEDREQALALAAEAAAART